MQEDACEPPPPPAAPQEVPAPQTGGEDSQEPRAEPEPLTETVQQPGLRRSAKPPRTQSDPPSTIGTTVVPSEPRPAATWTS